jgi:ribosomal protein S18 acetylase RimI-like enzyme
VSCPDRAAGERSSGTSRPSLGAQRLVATPSLSRKRTAPDVKGIRQHPSYTRRLAAFQIVRGSAADIPALEPLWVAVHHVHAASMPELAPYVSDEETWRERRALYGALFRQPDTFLFLARVGGELVGYALGRVLGDREDWWSDTWRVGDRIGELESVSVLPEHRGAGIGAALLDAADQEFERLHVHDQIVGALPGNADAIRLYERRGFRPTWVYLSRFEGR